MVDNERASRIADELTMCLIDTLRDSMSVHLPGGTSVDMNSQALLSGVANFPAGAVEVSTDSYGKAQIDVAPMTLALVRLLTAMATEEMVRDSGLSWADALEKVRRRAVVPRDD